MKVPYSDKINFGFHLPWGGGSEDCRSIRVYYGSHSVLIPTFPRLTRPDTAWCLVDSHESPENYDWSFAVGHDMWLWPCGFKTAPYGRKLASVLADNHAHRVLKVHGWDEDTLALIESGDLEMVSSGPVVPVYRHPMLPAGSA